MTTENEIQIVDLPELSPKEKAALRETQLAFETAFPDSPPQLLWRVSWRKVWNSRLRYANWFASEKRMREHVAFVEDGRGDVIAIWKYKVETKP